jgi:hypothetical protein
MSDVLVYWRDYKKNPAEASGGTCRWHSNARMFAELHAGDRLWMVTSGKNLGQEAEQAGFLVAAWQVREVAANPGDDPAYPSDRYRYRVVADATASIPFDEPVLVDHIVRPAGCDRAAAIGRFLQGPRRLKDETVRLLRSAAGPQMAVQYLRGK